MEQPYFAKGEPPMGAKPKPRALHVDIYLEKAELSTIHQAIPAL
jgi:hypothetical protein